MNIFDIKHFALHDGPGIRTTVFLKGCPLRCAWCHNPESFSLKAERYKVKRKLDGKEIEMEKVYGEQKDVDELMAELLKDRIFYDESGGGVTLSGGEPMMQHSGIKLLLEALKKEGIHTSLDTCGYAKEELYRELLPLVDLYLYDLKLMDAKRHEEYTGVGNELILSNADMLLDEGKDVIFRIPFVPGVNDSDAEQVAMVGFLRERKDKLREVHILPYHDIGADKYRRLSKDYRMGDVVKPDEKAVERFKLEIEAVGISVSIGG